MGTGAHPTTPPAGGRIHVLQVVGNAIVGGMECWVERMIERLPRSRFAFTALCPFESPFTDRLRALDVEVLIAQMPDDPPWSSVQLAASLVHAGGIDLLHAHMSKAHLLAGLVGRLTGKPVLATVHGRQLSMLDLEVFHAAGSHLSMVCKQSYFHALGVGVSAGRLSCETNGVDIQVFQPRPGGAARVRAALGLADDTPLVGFVGRLSHEKGPEVFARAALLLHSRMPQAHCVMVGEGPMERELRSFLQQNHLDGHVHLLGLRHDMPAVYNELDLVVSSSHSEAMPLALMEAMASGLAVVATRVGGVPEIVEHGHSGWMVAAGDHDDIANRMAWLLDDSAVRLRMGRRGRERAMDYLNLDDSVARVGELLARVARPRGEAPRRVAPVMSAVVGHGNSGNHGNHGEPAADAGRRGAALPRNGSTPGL